MWSVINYINTTMSIIKQNPILAGLVAMWGATVLGYVLRTLPGRIRSWFWYRSTISITMDSDVGSRYSTGAVTENFAHAVEWLSENSIGHFTRELRVITTIFRDGNEVPVMGLGDGTHYVWWRKHLFIVVKGVKGEDKGRERLQYLRITMLGWNHDLLAEFVRTATSRPARLDRGPMVYVLDGSDWKRQYNVPKRSLGSVFLDEEVKDQIRVTMEGFLASREWFAAKHMTYKLSYMFHGEPGTGKTSLIRAIAHEYQLDMYIVDLANTSMRSLSAAFNEIRHSKSKRPVLVVFEDVDSSGVTKSRGGKPPKDITHLGAMMAEEGEEAKLTLETGGLADSEDSLSLSDLFSDANIGTLLNILDGVIPLDNIIFAMSTNHINKIDPAILRPGRTDYQIEVPFLHDKEIKAYLNFMFDMEYPFTQTFMPIAGCQLELLFKQYKHSIHALIAQLNTWENPKCLTKA